MSISSIKRTLVGGAGVVAAFAGFAMATPLNASAGYTNDCSTVGGTNLGGVAQVYTGSRTGAPTTAAGGVCVYNQSTPLGFAGGDVEAGVGPVGSNTAYAIVDGSDSNFCISTFCQGQGYIGVSNFDSGANTPGPGCSTCATTGSNGGGQVGVKGVATSPVNLPIACGDTSGPDWDTTSRDGCFVP
jgi:hypothetical protein